MIENTDIAHFAGVLDAMGRITIEKTGYLSLSASTKKIVVIQYLCNISGITVVETERDFVRAGCLAHCKEQHQHVKSRSSRWKVYGAKATIMLFNAYPYLRLQRGNANLGLEVGMLNRGAWKGNTIDYMRENGWSIPVIGERW
jgi:hypothetical protein